MNDIASHLQKYTKKSVSNNDDDCSREPFLKQAKIEPEEDKNECISSNKSEGTTLKKIIFIDSTWNQTNKIITDERLQGKKKNLYQDVFAVEMTKGKMCIYNRVNHHHLYLTLFRSIHERFNSLFQVCGRLPEQRSYFPLLSTPYNLYAPK